MPMLSAEDALEEYRRNDPLKDFFVGGMKSIKMMSAGSERRLMALRAKKTFSSSFKTIPNS